MQVSFYYLIALLLVGLALTIGITFCITGSLMQMHTCRTDDVKTRWSILQESLLMLFVSWGGGYFGSCILTLFIPKLAEYGYRGLFACVLGMTIICCIGSFMRFRNLQKEASYEDAKIQKKQRVSILFFTCGCALINFVLIAFVAFGILMLMLSRNVHACMPALDAFAWLC